jgi:hypothetical protein
MTSAKQIPHFVSSLLYATPAALTHNFELQWLSPLAPQIACATSSDCFDHFQSGGDPSYSALGDWNIYKFLPLLLTRVQERLLGMSRSRSLRP